MTIKGLFVGGPKHGTVMEVDSMGAFVIVPASDLRLVGQGDPAQVLQTARYDRHRLALFGETIYAYILSSLSPQTTNRLTAELVLSSLAKEAVA